MKIQIACCLLVLIAVNANWCVEDGSPQIEKCSENMDGLFKLAEIDDDTIKRMADVLDKLELEVISQKKRISKLKKEKRCDNTISEMRKKTKANKAIDWCSMSESRLLQDDKYFFRSNTKAGHNVYILMTEASWYEAKNICNINGLDFATLKTSDELDKVSQNMIWANLGYMSIWVDASDVGRAAGQFYWADGTIVDNSMWGPQDPNDFAPGADTCVNFIGNYHDLYDFRCSNKLALLCKKECP